SYQPQKASPPITSQGPTCDRNFCFSSASSRCRRRTSSRMSPTRSTMRRGAIVFRAMGGPCLVLGFCFRGDGGRLYQAAPSGNGVIQYGYPKRSVYSLLGPPVSGVVELRI